MGALAGLTAVLYMGFVVYTIVHMVMRDHLSTLLKVIWFLLILFPILGSLLYWIFVSRK